VSSGSASADTAITPAVRPDLEIAQAVWRPLWMNLVIEKLSKRYPNGVQALRDVTLTVGPGMFGLLGPNGAGKSTLMRTLATLQDPDTGSVRLGEIDLLRDKQAVRQVLGYLPQEFGVYPKVKAVDLLDHLGRLKGLADRALRKETVDALLRRTNLWEARNRALGTFSGGMKQRFGIAQALIGDPQLLIVDEPTAGLDPEERVRFHDLLSEIGESIIVLLSTHIVSDVSDLCSRMAIMHQGELRLVQQPSEAIAGLRGRLWERTVEKAEVARLGDSLSLISTRLVGGRTRVRVLAESAPGPGFVAAEPELEDVYFAVRRGADARPRAA
jgi:ABC-2 type transport system ATP-binding protein